MSIGDLSWAFAAAAVILAVPSVAGNEGLRLGGQVPGRRLAPRRPMRTRARARTHTSTHAHVPPSSLSIRLLSSHPHTPSPTVSYASHSLPLPPTPCPSLRPANKRTNYALASTDLPCLRAQPPHAALVWVCPVFGPCLGAVAISPLMAC